MMVAWDTYVRRSREDIQEKAPQMCLSLMYPILCYFPHLIAMQIKTGPDASFYIPNAIRLKRVYEVVRKWNSKGNSVILYQWCSYFETLFVFVNSSWKLQHAWRYPRRNKIAVFHNKKETKLLPHRFSGYSMKVLRGTRSEWRGRKWGRTG